MTLVRLSGNFPDYPETFQTIQKLPNAISRVLRKNFPDSNATMVFVPLPYLSQPTRPCPVTRGVGLAYLPPLDIQRFGEVSILFGYDFSGSDNHIQNDMWGKLKKIMYVIICISYKRSVKGDSGFT